MRAVNASAAHIRSMSTAKATIGVVTSVLLLGGLVLAPTVSADDITDGVPDQSEVDGETLGNGYTGGWGALDGGVDARPVVRALTVTNGDAVREVIDNTELAAVPTAENGFDVVITPVNLCRPDETPTEPGQPLQPGQRPCYSTPNRVQISIGYTTGGQLRTNFSDPAAAALLVTEQTEFDLTLNLNTLGQSLRWTWLQGAPTYWRTTNLGQEDATLRVRFRPRKTPIAIDGEGRQMGCSAIPVNPTCEFPEATEYRLQANLTLSLDQTLDEAFTGSLFATENAYIGSLEAQFTQTGPQMTWGIAAPVTVDGVANKARLWAVVPDAALLNYFGIPAEADPSGVLSGAIDSASTGARLGWSPWSANLQGTDGWLVSTSALSVDETDVQSGGQSMRSDSAPRAAVSSRSTVAEAVKVDLRRKSAAPQVSARFQPRKPTTVTFTGGEAQASICRKRGVTCRVVISRVRSDFTSAVTQLAVAPATPTRTGITVTRAVAGLRSGQEVLVVLQRQAGGRGPWAYVTSGLATVLR